MRCHNFMETDDFPAGLHSGIMRISRPYNARRNQVKPDIYEVGRRTNMNQIITVKQQVYNILKARIESNTFQNGQRLCEIELAESLQVSRSPVREALKQLVHEGVLLEYPNKGVVLRAFTDKQIDDIFSYRSLIECYAVDILMKHPERMPESELKETAKLLRKQHEPYPDNRTDRWPDPHTILVQASCDECLTENHRRVRSCTMSYNGILLSTDCFRQIQTQHLEIVESLLAMDYKHAKLALTEHFSFSGDRIAEAIRAGRI
ncbi:MAG: GntR family transcriptional regulator [Clostridia bacterium]|nr:GntR family transcriptional regulator [Clostridia bacterium]